MDYAPGRRTSSGSFYCNTTYGYGPDVCTTNGSTLTLRSGTATMTFTFAGLMQTLGTTNVQTTTSLGTLTAVVGGTGPFVFPTTRSGSEGFGLFVDVAETGPVAASYRLPYVWYESGNGPTTTTMNGPQAGLADYFVFPTTPVPDGFAYAPSVIMEGPHVGTLTAAGGTFDFRADTSIVPEPTTLALTLGGLAVLRAGAWRRRRAV